MDETAHSFHKTSERLGNQIDNSIVWSPLQTQYGRYKKESYRKKNDESSLAKCTTIVLGIFRCAIQMGGPAIAKSFRAALAENLAREEHQDEESSSPSEIWDSNHWYEGAHRTKRGQDISLHFLHILYLCVHPSTRSFPLLTSLVILTPFTLDITFRCFSAMLM